ncbi:MAG: DUF3298 domain-containing protein [Devosia sp.]
MRMILAGLLVLGAVPAAEAASFSCDRASTPVEKAICSNPELSRRDEVLAKAYATALGGLSDEARTAVQAGQRAWLDYAGLACTTDARPFSAPLTEDQQACLGTVYRARIDDLAQSRMQGDWRFYPVTRYDLVDDPDPDAYQGVATKEISSPRIDDDSEVAATFNQLMDDADDRARPDPQSEDYRTSDTTESTVVDGVNTHRISLRTTSYWMGHGAAHGNYAITYAHYLTDEERLLEAADLFTGEGWEAALGQLALAELDRTVEGGIWDESRADVPGLAADPSRWRLTDAGLEIVFQPYEVTAYAAGAPTVTIGWDKLAEYLSENYSELLY